MTIPSSLNEYKSKIVTQATAVGKELKTAVLGEKSVKDTLSLNNVKNKIFTKSTSSAQSPITTGRPARKFGEDLRVRISLPPESPDFMYLDESNGILSPLKTTNGFIFPVQPQIALGYEAAYQETAPTHSNFAYYTYQNSKLSPIQLTGDFPIRTAFDANYVMAGIHFLRSCTRMFNGRDGQYAGAPPMVLRLNGLGFSGYDNIPVVVSSFTATYSENVDFISFKPFSGYKNAGVLPKEINMDEIARLPVSVQLTLQLNPVFSRKFITNEYATLDYSMGKVRLLGKNTQMQAAMNAGAVSNNTPEALPLPPIKSRPAYGPILASKK